MGAYGRIAVQADEKSLAIELMEDLATGHCTYSRHLGQLSGGRLLVVGKASTKTSSNPSKKLFCSRAAIALWIVNTTKSEIYDSFILSDVAGYGIDYEKAGLDALKRAVVLAVERILLGLN